MNIKKALKAEVRVVLTAAGVALVAGYIGLASGGQFLLGALFGAAMFLIGAMFVTKRVGTGLLAAFVVAMGWLYLGGTVPQAIAFAVGLILLFLFYLWVEKTK